MGFNLVWVETVMKCITFISYLVIVNGKAEKIVRPYKLLRQGDPLRMFLFLICSNDLSPFIRLPKREELMRGEKASRSDPQTS